MINMAANNKDRKLILDSLDKCIKVAYSGVTCLEYDALRVVRSYIKTFYDRDKDLKSSGSEDK